MGRAEARLRHVRFEQVAGEQFEARLFVAPVDQVRLSLFDQPGGETRRALSVPHVGRSSGALAAVNAGFFHPDFSPAGLFIDGGTVRVPVAMKDPVLTGILAIDSRGQVQLLRRSSKIGRWQQAVQAGPFLVDPGGKLGIRKVGRSALRTFIALGEPDLLIVATTTSVTLKALASALHEVPEGFGARSIERALNLDGGSSTAMWVDAPRPYERSSLTAVRNILLVEALERSR